MASKNKMVPSVSVEEKDKLSTTDFYFGKENFKWMLIGLACIVLGFILMLGPDANTVNGKFDPNQWNEDIFSFRRIRIAPLLVVIGFILEGYAIMKVKAKP